jgi:hypothetical protein
VPACASDDPVAVGIVERPEDYLYSSAGNYAGLGSLLEVELVPREINLCGKI